MDVCRGLHYFIIFVEYWKFNTPKNSIDSVVKIFCLSHTPSKTLHPEACSRRRWGSSRQDRQTEKSWIWARGGWYRVPCAALASPSQLRVGRSVWEFSRVCLAFRDPTRPSGGWQLAVFEVVRFTTSPSPAMRYGRASIPLPRASLCAVAEADHRSICAGEGGVTYNTACTQCKFTNVATYR